MQFNKNISYIDFNLTIEIITKNLSILNIIKIKKNITKLIIEGRICLGIKINNDYIIADMIIVAADPWTPGLLERS